jgi:murein DD-endopeptidase MepM/ murein hydrolase activator NlpD
MGHIKVWLSFVWILLVMSLGSSALLAEPLSWPLYATGGKQWISSEYGYRVAPMGGGTGSYHTGIDIACRVGTPVVAVGDGVVIVCAFGDSVYGKYIVLRLDSGVDVLYGHLSETWYSRGSRVERGRKIGLSGNTGASTGPHLHLGIMTNPLVLFGSQEPADWRLRK